MINSVNDRHKTTNLHVCESRQEQNAQGKRRRRRIKKKKRVGGCPGGSKVEERRSVEMTAAGGM